MATIETAAFPRPWMNDELVMLRDMARACLEREAVANHERRAKQQHEDGDFWRKAGEVGILCASIPEQYGGGGGTFAHEAVLSEELGRSLDASFGNGVHSTICAHYILDCGTEEQKQRWLPPMAT